MMKINNNNKNNHNKIITVWVLFFIFFWIFLGIYPKAEGRSMPYNHLVSSGDAQATMCISPNTRSKAPWS